MIGFNIVKILMITIGFLLITSSALAFSFNTVLNQSANTVTGLTEDKANLISGIGLDTTTITMIFLWVLIILLFKDKIILVSLIGGILLILYARGLLPHLLGGI